MIVECLQLAPVMGDLPANRLLTTAAIARSSERGAGIIVLPELCLSGYCFESPQEALSLAVTPSDRVFGDWGQAAGGSVVVAGFCELGEDGHAYNSAAILDSTGVLGVYRKVHLWDREKLFFQPGAQPPTVTHTRAGRIGTLICYDAEFPEMVRGLALAGAELIAVPTNWPLVERPVGERAPEVVMAMASARANRVAIACCDRSGTERGQQWTSMSTLIGPDGWIAGSVDSFGVARAEIDMALSRDKRISDRNDALGDRRPDIYEAMQQIATRQNITTNQR